MILLVAGSRSITSYDVVAAECDKAVNSFGEYPDVVISGGARGVDRHAERWARERNFPFVPFIPLWDEVGKRAGFLRNKQMAIAATHALIIWDGESRGAAHMRDIALELGVKTHVSRISG